MINNPIPLLNSQIANGPIDVEIKKKNTMVSKRVVYKYERGFRDYWLLMSLYYDGM